MKLTFGQSGTRDRLTNIVAVHLAKSHIVQSGALVQARDKYLLIVHIDISDAILAIVELLQRLKAPGTQVPDLNTAIDGAADDQGALVHVESYAIDAARVATKLSHNLGGCHVRVEDSFIG